MSIHPASVRTGAAIEAPLIVLVGKKRAHLEEDVMERYNRFFCGRTYFYRTSIQLGATPDSKINLEFDLPLLNFLEELQHEMRANHIHFKGVFLKGGAVRQLLTEETSHLPDLDFSIQLESQNEPNFHLIEEIFLKALLKASKLQYSIDSTGVITYKQGDTILCKIRDPFHRPWYLFTLLGSRTNRVLVNNHTTNIFSIYSLPTHFEGIEQELDFQFVCRSEKSCVTSADSLVIDMSFLNGGIPYLTTVDGYDLEASKDLMGKKQFDVDRASIKLIKDGLRVYCRMLSKGYLPVDKEIEKLFWEKFSTEYQFHSFGENLNKYLEKHYSTNSRGKMIYLLNYYNIVKRCSEINSPLNENQIEMILNSVLSSLVQVLNQKSCTFKTVKEFLEPLEYALFLHSSRKTWLGETAQFRVESNHYLLSLPTQSYTPEFMSVWRARPEKRDQFFQFLTDLFPQEDASWEELLRLSLIQISGGGKRTGSPSEEEKKSASPPISPAESLILKSPDLIEGGLIVSLGNQILALPKKLTDEQIGKISDLISDITTGLIEKGEIKLAGSLTLWSIHHLSATSDLNHIMELEKRMIFELIKEISLPLIQKGEIKLAEEIISWALDVDIFPPDTRRFFISEVFKELCARNNVKRALNLLAILPKEESIFDFLEPFLTSIKTDKDRQKLLQLMGERLEFSQPLYPFYRFMMSWTDPNELIYLVKSTPIAFQTALLLKIGETLDPGHKLHTWFYDFCAQNRQELFLEGEMNIPLLKRFLPLFFKKNEADALNLYKELASALVDLEIYQIFLKSSSLKRKDPLIEKLLVTGLSQIESLDPLSLEILTYFGKHPELFLNRPKLKKALEDILYKHENPSSLSVLKNGLTPKSIPPVKEAPQKTSEPAPLSADQLLSKITTGNYTLQGSDIDLLLNLDPAKLLEVIKPALFFHMLRSQMEWISNLDESIQRKKIEKYLKIFQWGYENNLFSDIDIRDFTPNFAKFPDLLLKLLQRLEGNPLLLRKTKAILHVHFFEGMIDSFRGYPEFRTLEKTCEFFDSYFTCLSKLLSKDSNEFWNIGVKGLSKLIKIVIENYPIFKDPIENQKAIDLLFRKFDSLVKKSKETETRDLVLNLNLLKDLISSNTREDVKQTLDTLNDKLNKVIGSYVMNQALETLGTPEQLIQAAKTSKKDIQALRYLEEAEILAFQRSPMDLPTILTIAEGYLELKATAQFKDFFLQFLNTAFSQEIIDFQPYDILKFNNSIEIDDDLFCCDDDLILNQLLALYGGICIDTDDRDADFIYLVLKRNQNYDLTALKFFINYKILKKDWRNAHTIASVANKINPTDLECHFLISDLYLFSDTENPLISDKMERSINHAKEICKKHPESFIAFRYLYRKLMDQATMKEAQESYTLNYLQWEEIIKPILSAIALNPNDAESHRTLGFAYIRQGNPLAALKAFNEAVRIDRNDPSNYYELSLAHYLLKNDDEAIRCSDKFIELTYSGATPSKQTPLHQMCFLKILFSLSKSTNPEVIAKGQKDFDDLLRQNPALIHHSFYNEIKAKLAELNHLSKGAK